MRLGMGYIMNKNNEISHRPPLRCVHKICVYKFNVGCKFSIRLQALL